MDRPIELPIPIEELMLDVINPRLEEGQSQPEILEAWASDPKTYRMAAHLAQFGPSPLKRLAVIPHPDIPERYIAVEGNRRVAAMKLLSEPALAGTDRQTKRFAKLAKEQQATMPDTLPCVVAQTREEWERWIELEHSGEADGVGTVQWEALQKTRFNVRRNKPDQNAEAMRLLDYAHSQKWITKAQQENFPITNLSRILGDTRARNALGIQRAAEGPPVDRPAREARRLVATLVAALSEKGVVRQIDKSNDRLRFVLKQLEAAGVEPAAPPADAPEPKPNPKPKPKRKSQRAKPRETFIPGHVDFVVKQDRCFDIFDELQHRLKVAKTPNAIVVLFRVFLELCTDHYLEKIAKKRPAKDATLKWKIMRCLEVLAGTPYDLTATERQALTKVMSNKDHPLNPDTLNAFVHNADLHPVAADLLKRWTEIAPFVSALWRHLEKPKH